MLKSKVYSVAFLVLCLSCSVSAAENRSASATYRKIYLDVKGYLGCFRRFNGTHEIGCTTGLNGNVGVLHYINDTGSLDWLVNSGANAPYIPLFSPKLFTAKNIRKVQNSGKVNGLMVAVSNHMDKTAYPDNGFSPDLQCPNRESSIYRDDSSYTCEFNPEGSGLMFEDMKMPIMLLAESNEIQKLISLFRKHNEPSADTGEQTYPLAGVELKAYMHGAGNTKICMRRNNLIRNLSPESYCQKLSGYSSYAFLTGMPKNETRKKNSTIIISARSDSFSMFDSLAPGASSPVPGITVLLAVAEALFEYKDLIRSHGKSVLFTLLTGESFDYIGSQRVVYDMDLDLFPNQENTSRVSLEDIELMVELSQFMNGARNKRAYIHTDPKTSANFPHLANYISELKNSATLLNLNMSDATPGSPLPPASAQMFIRAREDGIPAILLADHDQQYQTKYYNGYLDNVIAAELYPKGTLANETYDLDTEQSRYLTEVASAVANSILHHITGSPSVDVFANNATVAHLLSCFLVDPKCDLFYTVVSPGQADVITAAPAPFPFYISVLGSSIDNSQQLMRQLLAYFTGVKRVQFDQNHCTGGSPHNAANNLLWINGVENSTGERTPYCIETSAHFHNSSSPAFEMSDDYDFTSTKYSTWTESVWPTNDPFHVRVFLIPSQEVKIVTIVTGVAILILSFVGVYFLNKKAVILFPPVTDEQPN